MRLVDRHELITPTRPTRIAFFLGSDLTSHIIANRLLPILLDSHISASLFLTRGKTSGRRPLALRRLFIVEHVLLRDYAYPYVDLHGVPGPDRFNSPEGWRALAPGRLTVRAVQDVNDPRFVAELAEAHIDAAFSVRCYQRFRQPILDVLGGPRSGGLFANLHPGLLPYYRGVNTFLRSMQAGEQEAGFSLHHLEPDWDTGPVIGQARFPLDYSRPVLDNMTARTTDAAGLILDVIRRVATGEPVPSRLQDASRARYFSYPAEQDLLELDRRGVSVYRASSVIDLLTDAFFGTVPDIGGLRDTLIDAVDEAGIPCEYVSSGRPLVSLAG
jgi:hypothetical protein